jgi:magnesium-protoporphyrin IX monomethyl ester (oxidative) cyclase
MGDWVFSASFRPANAQEDSDFLFRCYYSGLPTETLLKIKEVVPSFIDELADRLLSKSPRIIGCSSTFQQHGASLALLKRIKEKSPDTITMIGGANCDGAMGVVTHRNFNWVDFVVSGEADHTLPRLSDLIAEFGNSIPQDKLPPGVIGNTNDQLTLGEIGRGQIDNLDDLPTPDFSEYLPALKEAGLADTIVPGLVMEASRGCWWGQNNQCVFCGINPLSIKSRTKKAEKVIKEIETLVSTYGISRIEFSDYIMPMSFFSTLLPYLSNRKEKLDLFFETTACLNDEHIRQLSEAGIAWIQAGIEGLDDDLLRLLNKASKTWQNIQLLKSCQKYGVSVAWNYLANIPGDTVESYEQSIELLPLLYHLQSPRGFIKLRYDRFSPLYHNHEKLRLRLTPNWPYKFVYPSLSEEALNDIAYFFQDESAGDVQFSERKYEAFERIEAIIDEWQKAFMKSRSDIVMTEISTERPRLAMQIIGDEITIEDTRPCAVENKYVLRGPVSEIYRASDKAPTIARLLEDVKGSGGYHQAEIEQTIEYLLERKLVVKIHDRLIGLAVEMTGDQYRDSDNYPCGLVRIPRNKS